MLTETENEEAMLVITADQVHSRTHDDLAGTTMRALNESYGDHLILPVDRNAGDEIQMIVPNGALALQITLDLTRHGQWSVGLGAGTIRTPLPKFTREASGPAFVSARNAIGRAKKRPTRFAADAGDPGADPPENSAANAEALLDLLLVLRSRRSEEGWELFDLLRRGLTQRAAAGELGISPQAVSGRAKIAAIHQELASYTPLAEILGRLDHDTETERHQGS